MVRMLLIPAFLAITTPAFAQMNHGGEHAHSETSAAPQSAEPLLTLADRPDLSAALSAGGEPVVASVLGAVCDFCAMAMNKTFGKRDEVAAVYVDLDAKTLNLVLKPNATMTDETIRETVLKAGYKVSQISRGESLFAG
jgi:copper chaperone CopZ